MPECLKEKCNKARQRVVAELAVHTVTPSEESVATLKSAVEHWLDCMEAWGEEAWSQPPRGQSVA